MITTMRGMEEVDTGKSLNSGRYSSKVNIKGETQKMKGIKDKKTQLNS